MNDIIFLIISFLGLIICLITGARILIWLQHEYGHEVTQTLVGILGAVGVVIASIIGLLQRSHSPLPPAANNRPPTAKPRGASRSIPKFPLPAPPASATIVLPRHFFSKREEEENRNVYLDDVDKILSNALNSAGYFEKSYYAVPDGFAIVTRLEQINFDGTPKRGLERWATKVLPLRYFDLEQYILALFTSNPGYYRVIVFIVTHPFYQEGPEINHDEATAWLREGLNTLPRSIGKQSFSLGHTSTALIYEFEQSSRSEQGEVNIKIPGRLEARTHLVKAGLWTTLEK